MADLPVAPNEFATDDILPPPPADAVPLHDREYRVRAFRLAADRMLLQGAVRDQKPPGLYIRRDPDPLTIHHMQVSLEVSFPALEILHVHVHFEMHPAESCPTITEHYGSLVGLSIARGFTHKIRELFGGPRGCSHTTALLQAMAPVAVQTIWSMHSAEALLAGEPDRFEQRAMGQETAADDESWKRNLNTCHLWAEDGEFVQRRASGQGREQPLFIRRRLETLDADD